MNTSSRRDVPTFDVTVLERLAVDLEDDGFVKAFARCFLAMLPGRVDRVTGALSGDDVECVLDATLSLKVSSMSVGACELAQVAGAIETAARRRDLASARTAAGPLDGIVARAAGALTGHLSGRG